ncbi:transcriptional activator Myb [Aspergillus udagawae]|uniref:Transcriptional activator Myb n=1 Tax=Aspergillus udagawae TaxID=91492 RepID=A0A8H3SAG7_9EURO|nr:transcriptional activator Myb [Aspergillus udagawae]
MPRLPKKWTAEEDDTLRREVESQPSGPEGRDWCQIAEKLPGRTNKDCRKRWQNTMAGEFRKGLWAKHEDEQLRKAIAKHGTRWTIVASGVKTRSAEQCAKRWQNSLNPNLDRSEWTESEDRTLIEAVKTLGRKWTQIQGVYFAERSKTAIKNRIFIESLGMGALPDAELDHLSGY